MHPDELSRHETVLAHDEPIHLGIWRAEGDELTEEFFSWDVPDLTDECRAAIAAGVRDDVTALDLDTMTDLLLPGPLSLETGIARTPSGGLGVAVRTRWPGTAPELIDWWFGWHLASTQRYKLWHPQAHLFAQPRYALADLRGLDDRERYVGNVSWVDEYIGTFVSRLAIAFHDPGDLGLTPEGLEDSGHGAAVAAVVTNRDDGVELARLVHAVRRTGDGAEMRSRFVFPPGTPEVIGPPMLDHCWTEMTHLAGFLPRLHARVTGT